LDAYIIPLVITAMNVKMGTTETPSQDSVRNVHAQCPYKPTGKW